MCVFLVSEERGERRVGDFRQETQEDGECPSHVPARMQKPPDGKQALNPWLPECPAGETGIALVQLVLEGTFPQ